LSRSDIQAHLARQIIGAEIDGRRSRHGILTLALVELVLPRFVLIALPLNCALLVGSRLD
jgi:hypothetical protein